jgi:hypothetical protein
MRRSAAILVALAAALLVAAPAHAVDPLPLTSVSPPDRAVVPLTPTGGIPWQIGVAGVPADAAVSVTVTSSPATGPDGVTLLDANRVDFFFLSPSPTAAGEYTGRSDPGPNAWSADAATYYWQVRATWTDPAGVFHAAASAIERIFVGTAPPATPATPAPGPIGSTRTTLGMSSLDATFYVRAVIRRRTRRAPLRLHYGCARLTSRAFRCRPTWRDRRNRYSATATFTHTRRAGRVVARATFTGRRASRTCTRTRSVARCGVRFRWRATLAPRPIPSAR